MTPVRRGLRVEAAGSTLGRKIETVRRWTRQDVTVGVDMIARLAEVQNQDPAEYAGSRAHGSRRVGANRVRRARLRTDVPLVGVRQIMAITSHPDLAAQERVATLQQRTIPRVAYERSPDRLSSG